MLSLQNKMLSFKKLLGSFLMKCFKFFAFNYLAAFRSSPGILLSCLFDIFRYKKLKRHVLKCIISVALLAQAVRKIQSLPVLFP